MRKISMTIPISREMVEDNIRQRFPRRYHTIKHPITPKQQAKYDAFVKQWNAAMEEFDYIVSYGERKGWAYGIGGYDAEQPQLRKLEPRVEYIYDETDDEWHARVTRILEHHRKTGEWLEQPEVTWVERMSQLP